MVKEVIGPREKPCIVILLSSHVDKLPSNYLCLYLETGFALNVDQRTFFL